MGDVSNDVNHIYQYYTVINDNSETLDNNQNENEGNQIVCLQIKSENDVGSSENPDTLESRVTDENVFSPFEANVEIITLDDGTVFMTTTPDEKSLASAEPDLVEGDCMEKEISIQDNEVDNIEDNVSDAKYELVQLLDNSSQMYEMVYCDITTDEQDGERYGDANGKNPYVCLYEGCGKMFSLLQHLNVHMRHHIESRPYVCAEEGCDKTFSSNYSLRAHIRTHTGEKPYRCTTCEKCFKTSGDLHKHIRIHTGEKPFLCPIDGCGKSFTTSNIRKVHIRSHTGERPYACDYPNCGKAFSSSTNYKNHVRIHSGERPYVCKVKGCEKRFTEYSSLYKHNLVHITDRPYTCEFCSQKFKLESAMNVHIKLKHSVIITSDNMEIVVDLN